MKKILAGACLFGLLAVVGCGSDDDGGGGASDPTVACKSANAEICAKFFGCYDQATLDLLADTVGNNEADCKTKLNNENCNAEAVKCPSGTTYDSGAASECLNQIKALNCTEFMNPNTATPASCEDDAICH
jgi:hypothetical protein